ncbi:prolyl oligopeptidase family serine peptidase [Nocardia sp. CDC159]|uniref:prolyl oligopeptidase n=1 Tax=Nocardia pulmonis TaxID=2951408 RepID=A0A9X2IY71_9NOCA|nr:MULTISPECIES: prolyl oligopeptidase family serine peptidase [Nocardia]MCM6776767.1 prolyl oligopeptidase family serine peptidase [Nocardia pulmonis]MCM6789084.1 prolyl oligopeptidase family serine peptidase [Nocardia sp. CDC159]
MTAEYPDAPASDAWDDLHGMRIPDPFRPLEDPEDPANLAWVAAQRRLAESYLADLPGQRRLREVLDDIVVAGPTASPVKSAGSRRFRVGRARAAGPWQLQVADGPEADWRTLLDASALGAGAILRRWTPSPDGRFVAVQASVGGSEAATPLALLDAATGAVLRTCALTRYAPVEWLADSSGYYYVRRHADRGGSGVYRHRVGTAIADDELLVGDDNPVGRYHLTFWHDRWLIITGRSGTSRNTRVSIVDVAEGGAPRPLDLGGLSSAGVVVDGDGRIVALSTASSEFGQLLVAEPEPGGGWGPWRVLVTADAPAVLSAFALAPAEDGDRLLVLRTRDGYAELSVHDARCGTWLFDVELPGAGTVAAIRSGDEPGILVLSYTDWIRPLGAWRLDLRSGRVAPVEPAARTLPGITVIRTTYRSADDTEVPLTVLAPCGPRVPRPAILSCYGGFGITFRPGYQPDGLTWVLAGGVMAIAGVRGGGERGRRWHLDGAGVHKLNAFTDLHAAGDWLVDTGWTRRGQLALLGGSNGGLMAVGAMVQRPAAYAAVVSAGAPLDMVRYERWGLGRAWREEYGSATDPAALAVLLRYSPYYNVTARSGESPRHWPPALFTTGDADTRVPPVHSCKMVAALQREIGGPILLDVIAGKGHAGGGPDSDRALILLLAFAAHHTGLRLDGEIRPRR